jgi:hypothetical protein
VLEQLRRIATDVASTDAVIDFWGTGQPKAEDDCSSVIGRRLTELLRGRRIVVNREVEVRRRGGGGLGERTDLLVTASAENGDGRDELVEVVIEVKGCWHDELATAMKTQLVDRYLHEEGRRCGIYLALYFGQEGWTADGDRRRRSKCASTDHNALTGQLTPQAADLSAADSVSVAAVVLDLTLPKRSKDR